MMELLGPKQKKIEGPNYFFKVFLLFNRYLCKIFKFYCILFQI